MKNKIKRLWLLAIIICDSIGASAYDFEVGSIYYKITSSATPYTVAVTNTNNSSNKYAGSVTIPETVTYNGKTYSVTSIGDLAFFDCSGLTSIEIPSSVTSIGEHAFAHCTGLTSIEIPNSVTSIDGSAFADCTGLTSIEIPNSVTSIDENTFFNCSGLTSVTIGNSVTSIGSSAFYGCTGLTSVEIPNSVTSIGDFAFYNTAWYNKQPDGLVYAGKVAYKYKGTMPEGLEILLEEGTLGIAVRAFYNCSGLTSVIIPNSVNSIGNQAFSNCTGLTLVDIPNSVTSMGNEAFEVCI